ncbi:helix-turn-helix domain-containing protein [Brevibacterium sp. RIT 803]|uniref:AraC family transcriptional regulator n=1 Tax=Brevibacterium sp. RIT 803 TaxID=2810210 RepID=UPI00194DDD36|nr:helix-turn-helix domain-containing protein [Brevibacterium sp. RIT 803]MBM6591409.1 helix-turn-helix domain-containing protein [Brevibacterium sp. RIT 803]
MNDSSADRSPDLDLSPRRLRGQSPEEAREVGTELYYPHQLRIRGIGSRFEMRATATKVGPLSIGTLKYTAPVTVETGPYEDAYQVNIALNGSFRTSAGSNAIVANRSRCAVYRPDVDTAFSGWDSPCTMFTVKIERSAFERITAQYLGTQVCSPIDFELPMTIDRGDGAAWMQAVRLLLTLPQREDTGPLLIDHLVEETVVGLLWTGEHSLRPQLHGTSPASVSAFRRGVDLIHAIPEEALTLESLARYAGVSGRSLQLSFRRELDLSPMKYLKTVRLDRVAEALRESSPCDSSVSEVARRFGFTHLGRFAADYAQRHREKPSETRRRHS